MLDAEEIRAAIAELEYKESSRSGYMLLSALYNIQQHMEQGGGEIPAARSVSAHTDIRSIETDQSSDFLRAVSGKDPNKIWPILDDLMETLQVVRASVYDGVMERIRRA